MNATITRTIEALRSYVGMPVPQLQLALGLKPGTYFSRRRGETLWTAVEVKRAADALGVSVATLFDGLSVAGAGFEPATSGSRARHDTLAQVIPFPTPRRNVETAAA